MTRELIEEILKGVGLEKIAHGKKDEYVEDNEDDGFKEQGGG